LLATEWIEHRKRYESELHCDQWPIIMEPSFKRQRISGPVSQHRHSESYDDYHGFYSAVNARERPEEFEDSIEDDVEESEDDEVDEEDPDAVLQATRAQLDNKLKSKFEAIFEKYGKDFTGIGDEIDMRTGEIVVNNGHIAEMQDETDAGDVGKEREMLRAFTEEPELGLGSRMDDREDSFDADEADDNIQTDYQVNGRQMLRAFTTEPEFGLGNPSLEEDDEEEQDIGNENANIEEDSDDEDDILYQSSGVIPAKSMAASFKPPFQNQHQQFPHSRVQSLKQAPKPKPLSSRPSYPSDPDILSQFGKQLGPRIVKYVSQQKFLDDSSIEPKWRAPTLSAVTPGKRPILKSILLQPDERSPSPKRADSIWAPQRKRGRPRKRDIPHVQHPSGGETVVRDRTFITRELITTSVVPSRVPEQQTHRRPQDRRRTASNDSSHFGTMLTEKPIAASRSADQITRHIPMDIRLEPSYEDATFGDAFSTEDHGARKTEPQFTKKVDGNEEQRWDDDDVDDDYVPAFDDIEQSGGDSTGPDYEPLAPEESEPSEIENHLKNAIPTGAGPNIRLKNFKPKISFNRTKPDHAPNMTNRRSEKLPFTVEDDELLLEWVRSVLFETNYSIWGHKHWRLLGAKNPRHTALSWLDRYRKKYAKNGNQHLFPPPKPVCSEVLEVPRIKPGRPRKDDSRVIVDARDIDKFKGERPDGIARESPRTPPKPARLRRRAERMKDDGNDPGSEKEDDMWNDGVMLDDHSRQDETDEDAHDGRRRRKRRASSSSKLARPQQMTSADSAPYPELSVLERQAEHLSAKADQNLPCSARVTATTANPDRNEFFNSRTIPNSQSSSHSLLRSLSPPSSAVTLSKREKSNLAAAALLGRFRNTVDPSYDFSDDEDDAAPPHFRAPTGAPALQSHSETVVEQPGMGTQPFAQPSTSEFDMLIDPALLALDVQNAEPYIIHQPNPSTFQEWVGTNDEVLDTGVNVEEAVEIKEEPDVAASPKVIYDLPISSLHAAVSAYIRSPDISSAVLSAKDIYNMAISPLRSGTAPMQILSPDVSAAVALSEDAYNPPISPLRVRTSAAHIPTTDVVAAAEPAENVDACPKSALHSPTVPVQNRPSDGPEENTYTATQSPLLPITATIQTLSPWETAAVPDAEEIHALLSTPSSPLPVANPSQTTPPSPSKPNATEEPVAAATQDLDDIWTIPSTPEPRGTAKRTTARRIEHPRITSPELEKPNGAAEPVSATQDNNDICIILSSPPPQCPVKLTAAAKISSSILTPPLGQAATFHSRPPRSRGEKTVTFSDSKLKAANKLSSAGVGTLSPSSFSSPKPNAHHRAAPLNSNFQHTIPPGAVADAIGGGVKPPPKPRAQDEEEADELGMDDDDFTAFSSRSVPRSSSRLVAKIGPSPRASAPPTAADGIARGNAGAATSPKGRDSGSMSQAMQTPMRGPGGRVRGLGLGRERRSSPGSVVKTPGGSLRRCGERGFRCRRDFCFKCSS